MDALIGIVVCPVPLAAGGGDGEVWFRESILRKQEAERGDGYGHEDQDGDHRPGDLERGIVGGARRLRVGGLVEARHHVDEQAEDEEGNQRDDNGDIGVERGDLLHDRSVGVLEADLPRRWLPVFGVSHDVRGEHGSYKRHHSIEDRHPFTPKACSPPVADFSAGGERRALAIGRANLTLPMRLALSKGGAEESVSIYGVAPTVVLLPSPVKLRAWRRFSGVKIINNILVQGR